MLARDMTSLLSKDQIIIQEPVRFPLNSRRLPESSLELGRVQFP